MRMAAAATFFDRDQAYDAYTGAPLFKCQASGFNDASSDGATTRRRAMSTGPGIVIPDRRAIRLGSDNWVVSGGSEDGFQGVTIRQNYNLKKATNSLAVLTASQACLGAAGTSLYAHLHWYKDTQNQIADAELDTFWNVFVASTETSVSRGTLLRDETGQLYRVRQTYPVAEGFLVAQSDQLDFDARQPAVFHTGALDTVSDTYGAGTVNTFVLQIKPSKYFRFRVPTDAPLRPGDTMVVVPKSALTVTQNMLFEMDGADWRAAIVEQYVLPAPTDSWYDFFFKPIDVYMVLARRA